MTAQSVTAKLLPSLLAEVETRDAELLKAASAFYLASELDRRTNQELRQAVRSANSQRGTDFATALLYTHFAQRLKQSPLTKVEPRGASYIPKVSPKIAIVPGAFYREHPTTGGDGRAVIKVAAQNGWQCETIPTESVGKLKTNAAIIGDYLERSREQVILVSLSKGTSDMIAALIQRHELAEKLVAWISLSGILAGTPMADWLLDRRRLRPAYWYMQWKHASDMQAVRDLRTNDNGRARGDGVLPLLNQNDSAPPWADIPTFHIAGFPLRRHLSGLRARLWHRRLSRDGPNDSVVMLESLLDAHGTVIPVWGADHYLKSSWDSDRAVATIVDAVCGTDALCENELSPS